MPRLASTALVIAVGLLSALTLAHPSTSRMLAWPLAGLTSAAWGLLVTATLLTFARARIWHRPPLPALIGAALLVLGAVASAAFSPFSALVLPLAWPTVGGVALFLLLHHHGSVDPTPRAASVLPFAAAGIVVAAYALWAVDHAHPFPVHSRNTAPFGHSTYTAAAMVVALPWLLLAALRARGSPRALWLAAAGLALVVLAGTQSRGGVFALGVVALLALGTTLAVSSWPRPRKLTLAALAGVTLALVVATNSRLRDLVVHQRWSDTASESNTQRRAMLHAAALLGREHPLLGWGPGAVPLAYPRVRAQLDGGVENVLQVHNTPLQLWATGGAVAVLGATLLVAGLAVAAWRARRDPLAPTAAASLAGLGLCSLTDHALDLPFVTLFAAANAALLTRAATAAATVPSTHRSLPVALVTAVAAALLVPATVRDLRARAQFEGHLSALERDDRPAALAALAAASTTAPHDPFFLHHTAHQLAAARDATRDPAEATRLTRAAIDALTRSLATGVHLEFAHFNLGWLHLDLGEAPAAERHFRAAAQLVPDKGGVYFGLGLARFLRHDPAGAIRAFALELVNDPRFLTSPAWETPTLAPQVAAVHAELRRLLAELRAVHPAAAVSDTWTRWLLRDPAVAPADLVPHNAESAAFLAVLPQIASLAPLPGPVPPFPSLQLYAAWQSARTAAEPDLRSVAPVANAFQTALAARVRGHRDDFRAFLLAPAGDNPALVSTYRRQRTGYGILARHPEGPPLTDRLVVQENLAVTAYAAGLFPRKGTIPGRFLLALLPAASP